MDADKVRAATAALDKVAGELRELAEAMRGICRHVNGDGTRADRDAGDTNRPGARYCTGCLRELPSGGRIMPAPAADPMDPAGGTCEHGPDRCCQHCEPELPGGAS
jgi:hypothetical protein